MSLTKWSIDFEEFNTDSKVKLLNRPKEFFKSYIAWLPESKDMSYVSRSMENEVEAIDTRSVSPVDEKLQQFEICL